MSRSSCLLTTTMHPPSSSTFSLLRSASAAPRKLPFPKSIKALSTVSSRSHAASSPTLRFQSRPTPSSSRAFATTSARCSVATQKPKTQHAEVVSYPSQSDLKHEEEDEEELVVEYVSPDDVAVQLTDRAAEVSFFIPYHMATGGGGPWCMRGFGEGFPDSLPRTSRMGAGFGTVM